jgi:hypothetical protein
MEEIIAQVDVLAERWMKRFWDTLSARRPQRDRGGGKAPEGPKAVAAVPVPIPHRPRPYGS